MGTSIEIFLLLLTVGFTSEYETCPRNQSDSDEFGSRSEMVHKIKRRSLVFPKGSAFVVTVSALKTIPIKGFTWNQDHEFDVIWPIPSEADEPKLKPKMKHRYALHKKYLQQPFRKNRRYRRELYSNFELALERFNLPGKTCILRTICEAKTFLNPSGVSLIEDLLRIILRNPITTKRRMDEYDLAFQTKEDCDLTYFCPLSLLNFFLNYSNS